MSHTPSVGVKRCLVCGWEQSSGRGETVLYCPDCGSTSWESVDGGAA